MPKITALILTFLLMLVVLQGFSQYSRINTDSLRSTLLPGESRFVVETFSGDSITSRQVLDKKIDSNGVEERYIVRFSASPLMGNRLKSSANIREIESEHAQFKKDFSELLSRSGLNQLKSTSSLIHREFNTLLNGVAVTMPAHLATEVKKLGYVTMVEKDELVRVNDEPSNAVIEVPRVWNELGYTGKGVVIAIIDTGVDTAHVCFSADKFVKGYDFANNDDNPFDDHFHGTHVAGIAAANADKIKGVAPDARIMPVKVMNKDGYGRNSDIIAGIEFALDPDHDPSTNDGAQVLSLSLGGQGYPDDAMSVAIDNAVLQGAVCVVAAGNAGSSNYTIQSPGCARKALTVGSCNNSGVTSSFSSRGPAQITQAVKPEVSAPGENIYSSTPGNKYESLSGTSMATPHVAGLAALLMEKHPAWEPENIKSSIIQSAQKVSGKVLEEGFGMVNAFKALQSDLLIAPYVLDLGVVDNSRGTVTIVKEVRVNNASARIREVTFSATPPKNGLSVRLSVKNLRLEPGETKALIISCTVDPNAISNFDFIPMVSTEVLVNVGNTICRLPIVCLIGKTIRLSFERTPDYCAVFNADWGSSINIPMNESKLELVVSKNKTDLLAVFDNFCRYVLKENIEQNKELNIDPKEAKNEVRVTVQSPEGKRLNLCDGDNEEFRRKGNRYSGFRLTRFTFFMDGGFDLPGIKKYFSNFSSDYVYENSLSAIPTYNKEIRQIIKVPVGLDQGLTESKELAFNSSDYKKLTLHLDLRDIRKNLYYTTDYRHFSSWNADPFLKDLHWVNPRSDFEFYMLPLPYDGFKVSDFTRFSFWEKVPESYPFDQPLLATGFFSLNREGIFSCNPIDITYVFKMDNPAISLSKNLMSPNISYLSKELINPSLVLYGRYGEVYTDSVYVKIFNDTGAKTTDTIISSFSYDYYKSTRLKNITANDSVAMSTFYRFNDLVRTEACFSFNKSNNEHTFLYFPRHVALKGNSVQNRYFLPADSNFISLSSWYEPKIFLRKKGISEWTEIGIDTTRHLLGPNYASNSLIGYPKGYYDLKIVVEDYSGTQSIAQWTPGFYICDETQADSLYLVELYQSTDGENWHNHSGWLTEKLNDWYGITVDKGRVTEIHLPGNNLSGRIPVELTKLTKLISLDVSDNKLKFIPDLTGLEDLKELSIQKNKLDFSSIVPNKSFSVFNFSPQDSLVMGGKSEIVIDDRIVFTINSNFEGNEYQWYKNDQLVLESDSSNYNLVAHQINDAGNYFCKVYNKDIPEFYIPTKKVRIKIQEKAFETLEEQSIETFTRGITTTNWVDIDNDGDEDLFVANRGYDKSSLFKNKMKETGQATFEEIRSESLFTDPLALCKSTWADYNNDGLEDLATFSDHWFDGQSNVALHLFENLGNGNFDKQEIDISINKTPWEILKGACWVDLNHDNYLDLALGYLEWTQYVGGHNKGIKLINSNGVFKSDLIRCDIFPGNILYADLFKNTGIEVILSYGALEVHTENNDCHINMNQIAYGKVLQTTNCPTLGDFDNDGDLDLFSPVDKTLASDKIYPNVILENKDNSFIKRNDLAPAFKMIPIASGSVCFDYDNDGDLDLAVSNNGGTNELYKNLLMETGKLSFEPLIDDAFDNEVDNWMGISASDLDLDGYMDLTKVSSSGVYFLKNINKGNNWLSVKCKGTVSNGSAIGAKVYAVATIKGKKVRQYREILAASGEMSVTSRRLHFGLGDASKIDSLLIKWPSGITNVFKDVAINQYMDVTESLDQIPVANAGIDQTVKAGDLVTLDGAASSDYNGEHLLFKWIAPRGIKLNNPNTVKPTFIAPVYKYDRSYLLTLVVSNGLNESSADQVTVIVKGYNNSPVAHAGMDQVVNEGDIVTLDGTASSDAELDKLSYFWTAPLGAALSLENVPKPSFTAPQVKNDSVLTFSLVVKDYMVSSQPATVKVTVLDGLKVGNAAVATLPFRIYPNPSKGVVYVEALDNAAGMITVSIHDRLGNEVLKKEMNVESRLKLEVSGLKEGVYLLKLAGKDVQKICKIVISK